MNRLLAYYLHNIRKTHGNLCVYITLHKNKEYATCYYYVEFSNYFPVLLFPFQINFLPYIHTATTHSILLHASIHSGVFSCFDVHHFVWIIFNSIRIMHSFQMHRDNSGISIAATVKHFKCNFVVRIACQHQCIAGFILWSIQRLSFSFCHFAHNESDQSKYRDS